MGNWNDLQNDFFSLMDGLVYRALILISFFYIAILAFFTEYFLNFISNTSFDIFPSCENYFYIFLCIQIFLLLLFFRYFFYLINKSFFFGYLCKQISGSNSKNDLNKAVRFKFLAIVVYPFLCFLSFNEINDLVSTTGACPYPSLDNLINHMIGFFIVVQASFFALPTICGIILGFLVKKIEEN